MAPIVNCDVYSGFSNIRCRLLDNTLVMLNRFSYVTHAKCLVKYTNKKSVKIWRACDPWKYDHENTWFVTS